MKKFMTATRVIILGFLIGALVGSFILWLPISQRSGVELPYMDALFVSTSAMCVTGLSTVNVGQTFSLFGQIILLVIIQMGGLGIVTFTTLILLALGRRITLSDRLLIQSSYNLDTLTGLVDLTKHIIEATFAIELIGAGFYALVFIPDYGIVGIWYAIFHSVSAFCNAGIDLLGGNSFTAYRDNVIVNLNTMMLIIAGGLGFPVYWEIAWLMRRLRGKGEVRKMNFHVRLVLLVTSILILSGMILTLLMEWSNPATLGNLTLWQKLQAALFQSVTLRTAGFATIDQANFTSGSCMIYLLFMFIGGSPVGTAGGVKTITVTILVMSVISNIKGEKEVRILDRRIPDTIVRRCAAIVIFSFSVLFIQTTALFAIQELDFLDVIYEMTSAIATVGLSRGITADLVSGAKLVVILAMYLGRIGPISLALAFNTDKGKPQASYAEGKVYI